MFLRGEGGMRGRVGMVAVAHTAFNCPSQFRQPYTMLPKSEDAAQAMHSVCASTAYGWTVNKINTSDGQLGGQERSLPKTTP